uniref:Uncharacterized protein n=1 Tax=Leersia perrieri TaxID=77586 RepID=A0A0D9W6K3_9ORYZ
SGTQDQTGNFSITGQKERQKGKKNAIRPREIVNKYTRNARPPSFRSVSPTITSPSPFPLELNEISAASEAGQGGGDPTPPPDLPVRCRERNPDHADPTGARFAGVGVDPADSRPQLSRGGQRDQRPRL